MCSSALEKGLGFFLLILFLLIILMSLSIRRKRMSGGLWGFYGKLDTDRGEQ